jgi:hypothetical protein
MKKTSEGGGRRGITRRRVRTIEAHDCVGGFCEGDKSSNPRRRRQGRRNATGRGSRRQASSPQAGCRSRAGGRPGKISAACGESNKGLDREASGPHEPTAPRLLYHILSLGYPPPVNHLAPLPSPGLPVPALVAAAGDQAPWQVRSARKAGTPPRGRQTLP